MLAKWTNRAGRWPVVMLGLVCTIAACVLILLNIPNDALLDADGSDEVGVINPPSEAVALTCSFLLGLGDAAGSTQMTSILGGVSNNIEQTFMHILTADCWLIQCHVMLLI